MQNYVLYLLMPLLSLPFYIPFRFRNISKSSAAPFKLLDSICSNLERTCINEYWLSKLQQMERPVSKALTCMLVGSNPTGFDAPLLKKDTLFSWIVSQKIHHENKIILVRRGDFYEAYGVDAIMMVEYCGLNPMGNKPRAGCHRRSLQPALDGLVEVDLTVAVFEEAGPGQKYKIKPRFLSQVISAASPTYRYNLCLSNEPIIFNTGRPHVGVCGTALGYSVSQIYVDERTIRIRDCLTPEALQLQLHEMNPVEPVYVQNVPSNLLNSDRSTVKITDFSCREFHKHITKKICASLNIDIGKFKIIGETSTGRPKHLYLSTAEQIGLSKDSAVPELVPHLISEMAPSMNFLKMWLMSPPPYKIADSMRALCMVMQSAHTGFPSCGVSGGQGKFVSLLLSKQANVELFKDIQCSMTSALAFFESSDGSNFSQMLTQVLPLVEFQTGLKTDRAYLLETAENIIELIQEIICDWSGDEAFDELDQIIQCEEISASTPHGGCPNVFFIRNEQGINKKVKPGCKVEVVETLERVEKAKFDLNDVIAREFAHGPLIIDMTNNAMWLKKKPQNDSKYTYIHPVDRNGCTLFNRYTTKNVELALNEYKKSVKEAEDAVAGALISLAVKLVAHLPTIVQVAEMLLILRTVRAHVSFCTNKGWCVPTLLEGTNSKMDLTKLAPYWMTVSQNNETDKIRVSAVTNDVEVFGMTLLTAPNMGGKSTLLRSVTVAALLANCGLMVPCAAAIVPRYDFIFLRTISKDSPIDGKSTFGNEMDDIRVMLRDATNESFVCLDEVCTGTSLRDGCAIGGALLEHLSKKPVHGFFSTHLHEHLLKLPLKLENVKFKQLEVCGDDKLWLTFRLIDGVCEDSLAFVAAQAYGISSNILERAKELIQKKDMKKQIFDNIFNIDKDIDSFNIDGIIIDDIKAMVVKEFAPTKIIELPPDWIPGLSTCNDSCVYVLAIHSLNNQEAITKITQVYVGETEALENRLEYHRRYNVLFVK
eukprot:GHVL01019118.1.p1 GENE.GHVL01019118.1~~GHVL01019118.1.p1  ORF type:complete len:992 (+),score=175.05 GHVL01019118.1:791-3766(+)